MAYLVGIQKTNGDWENFLLPFIPTGGAVPPDLLGQDLPAFRFFEAYGPLSKGAAVRMAKALRGVPKEQRRSVFLKKSEGLAKAAGGGRME